MTSVSETMGQPNLSPADMAMLLPLVFYTHQRTRAMHMRQRNGRFVHYTNASVALSILQKQEVWMRNAATMNDFSEVEHGTSCLIHAYHSDEGTRFKAVVNTLYSGFSDELESLFDAWLPHFRTGTYLACLSEHEDEEDSIGRLSMWRAYGGDSGVALVLNNIPFLREESVLKAYSSPVLYANRHDYINHFRTFVNILEKFAANVLPTLDRGQLRGYVFFSFVLAVLCTKHPGFREEKEWRVIYHPTYESSPYILRTIEDIRGIPQPVYKIPLRNDLSVGLSGIEIPELVNRVIIGPTRYPGVMYDAFVQVLRDRGVENPETKVYVSDIPLRT